MKRSWKGTRFIASLLFLVCLKPALGQKSQIDSLEKVLKNTSVDTIKIKVLYKLALQYPFYEGNSKKEQQYMKQLCELADYHNYSLGKAYCLDLQGISARNASNYAHSLSFHKKALKVVDRLNDAHIHAIFHNNTGVVYRRFDDYQNALYHHLEALKMAEKIQDKRNISTAVNSIGNIYLSMKEYGKSLNYFAKGLELEKELQNSIGIAINLNNTGAVYENLGDYAKALSYYTQSLSINQASGNKKGIAICFNDIGNAYRKMGVPKQALRYYKASLQLNEEIGDKKYTSGNYINLGMAYANTKDFSQSLVYLKKGLDMALQIGTKEEIQAGYESLSETYAKAGDYKTAFLYHHKANAYKDSLLNEHNQENIARLQTLFDTEQKEAQINLLEIEKKNKENQLRQQQIIAAALVTGLIFILVLLGIVYWNNRNRKKLNRILAYQNAAIQHQKDVLDLKNQELTRLSDEKTHLMSIVAHDLRSPLSRILGLSHLLKMESENLNSSQKEYIGFIGKTAEQLNDMIARVLDINAIESQRINLVLEPVDISRLLHETISNLRESAEKKNIHIDYKYTSGEYQATLDCGYTTQVFENLISNAIKFSPAHKRIFISLHELENKIQVEIKDQGPGFSKEDMPKLFGKFQKLSARPTAGEDSTGLGLSIAKKYMEAMQGEINCSSNPGQGAVFILTFRKTKVSQPAVR